MVGHFYTNVNCDGDSQVMYAVAFTLCAEVPKNNVGGNAQIHLHKCFIP